MGMWPSCSGRRNVRFVYVRNEAAHEYVTLLYVRNVTVILRSRKPAWLPNAKKETIQPLRTDKRIIITSNVFLMTVMDVALVLVSMLPLFYILNP